MDDGFRCPRCGHRNPTVTAVSDALLAIGGERSVQAALQRIVDAARELVGARYAALGIPHEDGGFAQFMTSGLDDASIEAIGRLPRRHGLLGAMLESPAPLRTANIAEDPRFRGWPNEHPEMISFLGVPIVATQGIIGAFYLTDKIGAPAFSAADQEGIELLATHAITVIENARLYERSRELSVVEERNRLARELHDSVSQTLFSVVLTAEAAATLVDREPAEARRQIQSLQHLARDALGEMRSVMFELTPPDIERDGLVPTLRKHVDVLRRVYPATIELRVRGEQRLVPRTEKELFRITQEALHNALKHAQANQVCVDLALGGQAVRVSVFDDGKGFDPQASGVRARHLGLTSMEERADALGGRLEITSSPGCGTTIRLELPRG